MSKQATTKDHSDEKRTESRAIADVYHSVEFQLGGLFPAYVFRVRDLSPSGLGILVKEDSEVLSHIRVGDILRLRYHRGDPSTPLDSLETEIRHITEDDTGFAGHRLVGLLILEERPDSP